MRSLNCALLLSLSLVTVAGLRAAEPAPTVSPAAEPIIAPMSAGTVDPVTQRRAADALKAFTAGQQAAADVSVSGGMDPVLADRMAAIDGWLREISVLLDKGETAAAGERFVLAAEAMQAFTAEERQLAGVRYQAARDRLQGFARAMVEATGTEAAPDAAPVAPVAPITPVTSVVVPAEESAP